MATPSSPDRTRHVVETGEPDSAGFTPAGEREADLPRAYTEAIPFVGRAPERARLDWWLDGPATVSVRVLTGGGGRGKTRPALDVCRARAAAGWRAGFVTGKGMERFGDGQNLAGWGWNAPTLAVLDYAAASTAPLRAWPAELADDGTARNSMRAGRHCARCCWNATRPRARAGGPRRSAAATAGRRPSPGCCRWTGRGRTPWTRCASRRSAIFAAAYRRAARGEPDVPPSLDARLAELSWGSEPLFLAMAGLLAARMGTGPALDLPADELAFAQARRKPERVRKIWTGHGPPEAGVELGTYLAALATLRGGLPGDRAHDAIRAERQPSAFDAAGDPEPIRAALHDARPGPEGGIAPVEPDPLGEALILERWGSLPAASQTAAVLRAYRDEPGSVAAVLVRTCQDFAIRGRRAAAEWLRAVCDAIGDGPDHTEHPLALMPPTTVGSREIAADLGRREAALAAIEEAIALHRELARARPDAFAPDLARSLWVLGELHAEAGRPELALSTLREGIERLAPSFAAIPAALMAGLVRSYISQRDALGREPDHALLAPVPEVFEHLPGGDRGAVGGRTRRLRRQGRPHPQASRRRTLPAGGPPGARRRAPRPGRRQATDRSGRPHPRRGLAPPPGRRAALARDSLSAPRPCSPPTRRSTRWPGCCS